MYLQFVLICVIIIIIIIFNGNLNENFDEKINRVTKTQCGMICTKIPECQGFAVNNDNVCYLSKTPIENKPHNSIFSLQYNNNDRRCNKVENLKDPIIATPIDLIKNATYVCKENATSEDKMYRIYVNDEKK
jgi:hypothetical protein